jgi:hypothetical protein
MKSTTSFVAGSRLQDMFHNDVRTVPPILSGLNALRPSEKSDPLAYYHHHLITIAPRFWSHSRQNGITRKDAIVHSAVPNHDMNDSMKPT